MDFKFLVKKFYGNIRGIYHLGLPKFMGSVAKPCV